MRGKRITILCGHYGSGKTNIAVNLAISLKKEHDRVAIADIDIVNPYFRTRDAMDLLSRAGVTLISSPFASSNVDLPALPQELYAITDDPGLTAVVDVGGDDRGALALGRWRDSILRENDYDLFMVLNFLRPLTRTAEDALDVLREIEGAARIPFTGLINNTNLGGETELSHILAGDREARRLSEMTGLPLTATTVYTTLYNQAKAFLSNVYPLHTQLTVLANDSQNERGYLWQS